MNKKNPQHKFYSKRVSAIGDIFAPSHRHYEPSTLFPTITQNQNKPLPRTTISKQRSSTSFFFPQPFRAKPGDDDFGEPNSLIDCYLRTRLHFVIYWSLSSIYRFVSPFTNTGTIPMLYPIPLSITMQKYPWSWTELSTKEYPIFFFLHGTTKFNVFSPSVPHQYESLLTSVCKVLLSTYLTKIPFKFFQIFNHRHELSAKCTNIDESYRHFHRI